MTTPKQVTQDRNRYYRLPDGTMLPSVTTVLGTALAKPALPGWAAKVVATEAMAELPRLVRMSRAHRDDAIKFLKGRPYAQRDEGAAAGSKIHKLIESQTLGTPFELPDPASPIGQSLSRFLEWVSEFKPEFEATEAVVVNRTIGYAGTLDAIARIPALGNRLCVIDWKSGRTGPFAEWSLQVAAYARAETLWLPDGTEHEMPPIEGGAVLRIRPEFYALHEVTADLDALLEVFAAAREVANWALDATGEQDPFGEAVTA